MIINQSRSGTQLSVTTKNQMYNSIILPHFKYFVTILYSIKPVIKIKLQKLATIGQVRLCLNHLIGWLDV